MNRTQEERNIYEKAKELHYPNTGMSDLDSFRHELRNAYAKGWLECKQQMMKEAIPRKVKFLDFISYNHCIARLGMSEEDTVKLIFVKED